MKLNKAWSLKELANLLNATFIGDENHLITGINEIHRVENGDLVFVDHPKYYNKALQSNATTILIDKEVEVPQGKAIIISDSPFRDYNFLTKYFSSEETWSGLNQKIDSSAKIAPNVTIGNNVVISEGVIIYPGVVIYDNVTIGRNSIIHANAVIGGHAFYYQKKNGTFNKMHSCGNVMIGENVEIGVSCTIDKGVSHSTIIGSGSKLDNNVHVGHDTQIGENCLFAAQVGIAGCVIIEDNVTLWGQVGVVSGVTLKKGTTVLGQSGIGKTTKENTTYLGSPADEAKTTFKEIISLKKLPFFIDKLS